MSINADGVNRWSVQDRVHPHKCVPLRPYQTISGIEFATAGWVDWYNARRLHGSLGTVLPSQHEPAHYAALTEEGQPL